MNFSKTINENIEKKENENIEKKENENFEKKENNNIEKKNITYKDICTKLNNIFSNKEKEIKNFIIEEQKIKSGKVKALRDTKVKFIQALIYSILHIEKHKGKKDVINYLNLEYEFESDNLLKRTTLYEKEKNIPLNFYFSLFKKLFDLYNDLFVDKQLKKLIAVDGTYNNTNVYNYKNFLETSLNMGFFDVTNEIPLDLTFNGIKEKNNELHVLIDYIKDNKKSFENVILILDRAYCSYKFIDLLNKNKLNYVCRFRNTCKNFDKIKTKGTRVIEFNNLLHETVKNDKQDTYTINNKKFESVVLEIENDYILVSNLDNTYSDNNIKEIYEKRWDIEVFFKLIKTNFNFENLTYTTNEEENNRYYIHNIKILICCIISKILEKTYKNVNNIKDTGTITKRKFKKEKKEKKKPETKKKKKKPKKKEESKVINVDISNNENVVLKKEKEVIDTKNKKDNKKDTTNDKNKLNNANEKNNNENNENEKEKENKNENEKVKCNIKINKTLLMKCVFNLIIPIFSGSLSEKKLKNNLDIFIVINKSDPTIYNKRICKTPFKKWYIKGYTHKSDMIKIVYYMLKFKDEINDNLKSKSNYMTIIKINYVDD
jgi:hypothetical protein